MASEMREFEGKDLDEAIAAASAALGMPAADIPWEVVEEGRRGVFGLGARLVRIRISEPIDGVPAQVESVPKPSAPTPAPKASAPKPAPRDGVRAKLKVPEHEAAIDGSAPGDLVPTVDRILELMGFRATADATSHDGGWTIELVGPDRAQLLKRDGEILDALEFLLNRMGRRAWPDAGSIRVACAGYRDHRDEEIVALTREAASAVARSGQPETLQEMNPYERRLVHLTVREFPGIVSQSDGDGFLKRVRLAKATD